MGCPAAPSIGFTRARLFKLAAIEREHFWFVGRRALVRQLLHAHLAPGARTVLDLGCGTGSHVVALCAEGRRAIGIDLRPEGLQATRAAVPRAALARATAMCLPLRTASLDAVTLLDVLEHVDDAAALAEVERVLKPGAIALLTVPAMPALWSARDAAAGHRRRYTAATLQAVIGLAGLDLVELRHYQFCLLPLVFLARICGRRTAMVRDHEDRPPAWLNRLLAWINRLEVRCGTVIRWPCGSSLVAVLRKRAG